jgi:hypothetical protein
VVVRGLSLAVLPASRLERIIRPLIPIQFLGDGPPVRVQQTFHVLIKLIGTVFQITPVKRNPCLQSGAGGHLIPEVSEVDDAVGSVTPGRDDQQGMPPTVTLKYQLLVVIHGRPSMHIRHRRAQFDPFLSLTDMEFNLMHFKWYFNLMKCFV